MSEFPTQAHELGFKDCLLGPKKIQFTVKEASVHHTAICTFYLEIWMNLQAQSRLEATEQDKQNAFLLTAHFPSLSYIYLI